MNEVQEPKKKSPAVWIAIGCAGLVLLSACAVTAIALAGGVFWSQARRPLPPTPVTTPTAPIAPIPPAPPPPAPQ